MKVESRVRASHARATIAALAALNFDCSLLTVLEHTTLRLARRTDDDAVLGGVDDSLESSWSTLQLLETAEVVRSKTRRCLGKRLGHVLWINKQPLWNIINYGPNVASDRI